MNRRAQLALEEADAWKGLGETPEPTWSSDRDPSEPAPGPEPVRSTGRSARYGSTIERAQAAVANARRAVAEARAVLAVQAKQQQSDELSRLAARIKGRSSVIVGTRQPVSGSSSISVAVNQAVRAADSALSFKTEELPPESARSMYVPPEYFPPEDFLPESPRAAYVPEPVHVEEQTVLDFNTADVPFFAPVELRTEVVDLPTDYLEKQVSIPVVDESPESNAEYRARLQREALEQIPESERAAYEADFQRSVELRDQREQQRFLKLSPTMQQYELAERETDAITSYGMSEAFAKAKEVKGLSDDAAARIALAYRYGGRRKAEAQGVQEFILAFPEIAKRQVASKVVLPLTESIIRGWDEGIRAAAQAIPGFFKLVEPTPEMIQAYSGKTVEYRDSSRRDYAREVKRQIKPIIDFFEDAMKNAKPGASDPEGFKMHANYLMAKSSPDLGERLEHAAILARMLNYRIETQGPAEAESKIRAVAGSFFDLFQDARAWAAQQ